MRVRHSRIWLGLAVLALSVPLALLFGATEGRAAGPAPYSLGERLKPANPPAAAASASSARRLKWDDLVPPDWDPMKGLDMRALNGMGDADPRAMEALDRLRRAWDDAPTRPELDGTLVRLPGFVVPLDTVGKSIKEFLLVPYFGACIHMPPPPSNQVVHVILQRPASTVKMMDAVWITGRLETGTVRTGLGTAGYRLQGMSVEPYRR